MLFDHQIAGADWLAARRRGILGDEPGLGKTRTLIAAVAESKHPLVICPAIVRTHWSEEFAELGYDPRLSVIKSYDEIVRGGYPLMKQLLDSGVDSMILDEIHRLSHADAQRTQLILGKNGYAPRLPVVYGGSGTPVPKNPSNFWTILSSLFPEVALAHGLRTFDDYCERFCVFEWDYYRGTWKRKFKPAVKNEVEFREILAEVMLRRTNDDVGLDVPKLFFQVMRLDPDLDEWQELEAQEAQAMGAIEDAIAEDSLEALFNETHVARVRHALGLIKAGLVANDVAAQLLDSTDKIVLFAYHRDVIEALENRLVRFGVTTITGDTKQSVRDERIEKFATDPRWRVFIGQNIACMEGMDGLQGAAHRAILVEPEWSAYQNEQLGKRIARIGQRAERCVAQMVALAGTLDEAIVRHNHREVTVAAQIGLGEK